MLADHAALQFAERRIRSTRHKGEVTRGMLRPFTSIVSARLSVLPSRNRYMSTWSTVWLFTEAIDTHKLPPQWDTAYLRYAVRQVRIIGFYCFDPGRVTARRGTLI